MANKREILSVIYNKYKRKCMIKLANEEEFSCSKDLVLKYNLKKGNLVDDVLLGKVNSEQRIFDLKQAALNYASYKPRTEWQVISKMKEKGFDKKEAMKALGFLKEFDLLDDEKYARDFIKDFITRKPAGMFRVKGELLKRGIDKDLIEKSLEMHYPVDETYNLAKKAAEKKHRMLSGKPLDKQIGSMSSYLQRQGFNWDIIRKIVDEFYKEKK